MVFIYLCITAQVECNVKTTVLFNNETYNKASLNVNSISSTYTNFTTVDNSLLDKIVSVSTSKKVYVISNYVKHSQKLDFDLIFEQLQSLEQQFVDFDPTNKPYTKVQGMFNSFVLTNTVTNLGNGRLKCSEIFQDSVDIIGLGIFQRERLSVNRTIIL